MGNAGYVLKTDFSLEELVQTIKSDNDILSEFDDIYPHLFNDTMLLKKYIDKLESSQSQFIKDDERIKKINNRKQKERDIENALALLGNNTHFLDKKMTYLRSNIEDICQSRSAFDYVNSIREDYLKSIFLALMRSHKRIALSKTRLSKQKTDNIISQRGEFLVNRFNKSDKKENLLFTSLLSEMQAIPNIHLTIAQEANELLEQLDLEAQNTSVHTVSHNQSSYQDTDISPNQNKKLKETFEKSVLCKVLIHVFKRTEEVLQQLGKRKPKDRNLTIDVPFGPSLDLLSRLQKDVIIKATCASNQDDPSIAQFIMYTHFFLEKAVDILTLALSVNSILSGESITPGVDARVASLIESSPLHETLRYLVLSINVFSGHPLLSAYISSFASQLTTLSSKLDRLNEMVAPIVAEEKAYTDMDTILATQQLFSVEVETPHKYYPDSDEEKVIKIPGATHLSVTFDPRCSTKDQADYLQLYRKRYKSDPILSKFSGQPANWPKIPIVVEGDTVVFHFHSNSFQTYWGYRCIVTGLVLKGGNNWMYDLQRSVGYLTARCLGLGLLGVPLSVAERTYLPWLDSPLLAGGYERTDTSEASGQDNTKRLREVWLSEYLETEGSEAVKSLEGIVQSLPKLPTDMMGGAEVGRAIRYFVAANLKHLGLVDVIMDTEKRNEKQNKRILTVLKEAQKVRKWLVQESQRMLKERDEVQATNSKEVNADTDPNFKYRVLAQGVIGCMKFLLSLVPTADLILHTNVITEKELSDLLTAIDSSNPIDANELESYMKKIKSWSSHKTYMEQQTPKTSNKWMYKTIPESVVSFVQTHASEPATLSTLSSLLHRRQHRARSRIASLNYFCKLFQTATMRSFKHDCLRIFSKYLQELGQVNQQLNACGPVYEAATQIAAENYYEYLLQVLLKKDDSVDEKRDASMQPLILKMLCFPFREEDHQFLQHSKIFDIVRHFMCPVETKSAKNTTLQDRQIQLRVKNVARLVYQYLTLRCMYANVKNNQVKLDTLQGHLSEMLVSDLASSVDKLNRQRNMFEARLTTREFWPAGGDLTEIHAINANYDKKSYMKLEQKSYIALLLLALVLRNPATKELVSTDKVLRLLLTVKSHGTTRMQRLVLRLLRTILINVSPEVLTRLADSTIQTNPNEKEQEKTVTHQGQPSFISDLFTSIGQSLAIEMETGNPDQQSKQSDKTKSAQDYRDGQVQFCVTAELVMLLRYLITASDTWSQPIMDNVYKGLAKLPQLVDIAHRKVIGGTKSDLYNLLAALLVVGGHTDCIRAGGRVEAKRNESASNTKEMGTVVYYNRHSALALVIFDSAPTKTIVCSSTKLRAITEIPPPVERFKLTKDLIPACISFITSTNPEDELEETTIHTPSVPQLRKQPPKRPKLDKPIATARQPSVPAEQWSCSACTFLNSPALTSCEICGTPNASSSSSSMFSPLPPPDSDLDNLDLESLEEEEVPEIPCNADLLYHQIRSRTTKFLCTLLSDKQSAQLLFREHVFPSLLDMAVFPTHLEEFQSLENMEEKEDRLWEMLYQAQHGFVEEYYETHNRYLLAKKIKHSPLRLVSLQIPTELDRGTARNVGFASNNSNNLIGHIAEEHVVGLARANFTVPNSVPAYYFEVTIIGVHGREREANADVSFAIGLYTQGVPLFGTPGTNSFSYQANTGALYHNSEYPVNVLDDRCVVGDVVGCLWQVREGLLSFTKNGKFLGPAFDQVHDRCYPAVWIGTDGLEVSVNFGADKFVFDFNSYLPSSYVRDLLMTAKQTNLMTEAEIKRRTQASELMALTRIFPLELCVVALEKCKDDLTFAANWLFEKGHEEIARMESECFMRWEQEAADRQERELLAATAIDSPNVLRTSGSSATGNTEIDVDEDQEIDFEADEQDDTDALYDDAEAARFLDDELGVDAPIQIARAQGHEIDSITLDELRPGVLMKVAATAQTNSQDSAWHPVMNSVVGLTGIVTAVNGTSGMVELLFVDVDTATKRAYWFSFQVLEKPSIMWQDPCREYAAATHNMLKRAVVEVETSLEVLKIRRAVLSLIADFCSSSSVTTQENTRFPVEVNNEVTASKVIALLKLAAAEFLSSGESGSAGEALRERPLLDSFKMQLSVLLHSEASRGLSLPQNINYKQYLRERRRTLALRTSKESHPLRLSSSSSGTTSTEFSFIQKLTSECIAHFVQAVEVPPPILIEETSHPYAANQDVRKKLHIPGAGRLLIRFDERCSINYSELMTAVSFYRDEEHRELVCKITSRTAFVPIVIPSDRVYYRFTSGSGTTYWGLRFSVIPLELRLSDKEALDGLNFELGYWLLELLLGESRDAIVANEYIIDICEALMWYVKSAKRSAKMQGIQLLIRIVQELPNSSLSVQRKALVLLNKLMTLRHRINNKYDAEKGNPVYSVYFQSLVELVCIARLAIAHIHSQLQDKPLPTSGKNTSVSNRKGKSPDSLQLSKRTVPITQLGGTRLEIISASYGVLKDPKRARNVTSDLQQFVNDRGNGAVLLLPSISNSIPFLTVDPAPGRKKILKIQYKITETFSGILVDEGERSAAEGQSLEIMSGSTWFDHVVGVADSADSLTTANAFPKALLMQAVRLSRLYDHYYPIIDKMRVTTSEDGLAVPDPGAMGNSFALSFWLFLTEDQIGTRRTLVFKGNNTKGVTDVTPAIYMNDTNRRLVFSVTTNLHAIESCVTKKDIPLHTWTHLVCVSDSRTIRVYVNGTKDNEHVLSADQTVKSSRHPIYLGKVCADVSSELYQPAKGYIVDCRWYFKSLDDRAIKDLSKVSKPKRASNPDFEPTNSLKSLQGVTMSELDSILLKHNSLWTRAMDEQLVDLICQSRSAAREVDASPFELAMDKIYFTKKEETQYPLLRNVRLADIRFRFIVLRLFNMQLATVLPFLDFSQSHIQWSLVRNLCKLKGLIFMDAKLSMWNKILKLTTTTGGGPAITINRPRAARAAEKGDPDSSKSVFSQAFRQMHFIPPNFLRQAAGTQTWNVTYAGEGGTDAGGLYRDCLSHMCADLMSKNTPLFIPCTNSDNQGQYLPNPGCTTSLYISMFQFVGKLMGLAIRGKHILNLDLPSIVWKQLVGDEATLEDLTVIDPHATLMLKRIANLDNTAQNGQDSEINAENFQDYFPYCFTVTSTDGREVELVANGADIKVNWENKKDWYDLVVKYRLNEFKEQVEALRKGMATVVPVQLLPLFTWKELELNVCGTREIDCKLLRKNTKYKGFQDSDKQVKWFWEMLEEFSTKEKELFLRFVWGRSRLPLRSEDFIQKMVVIRYRGDDHTLPVSHTCFFQFELPAYGSKVAMANKVLYAITECRAIDTDHAAANVDWDADD